MRLGEIIKAYRKKHGMTQQKFADLSGVSKSYISLLENGKTSRGNVESVPSIDVVNRFAKTMGMGVDALLHYLDPEQPISLDKKNDDFFLSLPGIEPLPKMKMVPRLGTIACGEPILAVENIESFDKAPETLDCDYSLVCKGDSMTGARILDGDIVYIRKQDDVDDGEIAAVLIGDDVTLKRIRRTEKQLVLWPENPAYSPMIFSGSQLAEVRIIGKAVAFLTKVK